jgi:predicted dehydrogenase
MRIGIIGTGGIAKGIHLPVLSRITDVELVACCDLQEDRLTQVQETFKIARKYTSYYDMFARETLDAVYVLTQPDILFRVARDCLCASLPVFMEKPMGITLLQAQTLRDLSLSQNTPLHVGFNRRHIPLVREALTRVREHTEITQAEGRFYKNTSPAFYQGCSDAFWCDVIHCADLVRYAAGSDGAVRQAATLETADETGTPNAWQSIMQFSNNVVGVVRSHYAAGGRVHAFEFHGRGASAFVHLGGAGRACKATLLFGAGGKQSLSAMGADKAEHIVELDGKEIAGSDRYEDYYGYKAQTEFFLDAVRRGGADPARLAEDFGAMRLIESLKNAKLPGTV